MGQDLLNDINNQIVTTKSILTRIKAPHPPKSQNPLNSLNFAVRSASFCVILCLLPSFWGKIWGKIWGKFPEIIYAKSLVLTPRFRVLCFNKKEI